MPNKTVFTQVCSTQGLGEVADAVTIAMRRLGGQVIPGRSTEVSSIEVIDATAGIDLAFVAKFQTTVYITKNKKKENIYDIDCQIRYSPNGLFWICFILGFCLFFPWIGNILFFFIDPVPSYQQALERVRMELE